MAAFAKPGTFFIAIFSNIFLIGQDVFMFLKLDEISGYLNFCSDFRQTNPKFYQVLFVPQAWTIGVEICFYLIAPFLVKRKNYIIISLLFLSLLLRYYLYSKGYQHDPWTYRFFPTEMAFFLLGILSYRLYKYWTNINMSSYIYWGFLILVVTISVNYNLINIKLFQSFFMFKIFSFQQWFYFAVISLSIPLLFRFTKKNKLDRIIGELSYPIYISHIFIWWVLNNIFNIQHSDWYLSIVMVSITVAFSYFLFIIVINPMEKIRQSRVGKAKL